LDLSPVMTQVAEKVGVEAVLSSLVSVALEGLLRQMLEFEPAS
jgi:hypothetical protein